MLPKFTSNLAIMSVERDDEGSSAIRIHSGVYGTYADIHIGQNCIRVSLFTPSEGTATNLSNARYRCNQAGGIHFITDQLPSASPEGRKLCEKVEQQCLEYYRSIFKHISSQTLNYGTWMLCVEGLLSSLPFIEHIDTPESYIGALAVLARGLCEAEETFRQQLYTQANSLQLIEAFIQAQLSITTFVAHSCNSENIHIWGHDENLYRNWLFANAFCEAFKIKPTHGVPPVPAADASFYAQAQAELFRKQEERQFQARLAASSFEFLTTFVSPGGGGGKSTVLDLLGRLDLLMGRSVIFLDEREHYRRIGKTRDETWQHIEQLLEELSEEQDPKERLRITGLLEEMYLDYMLSRLIPVKTLIHKLLMHLRRAPFPQEDPNPIAVYLETMGLPCLGSIIAPELKELLERFYPTVKHELTHQHNLADLSLYSGFRLERLMDWLSSAIPLRFLSFWRQALDNTGTPILAFDLPGAIVRERNALRDKQKASVAARHDQFREALRLFNLLLSQLLYDHALVIPCAVDVNGKPYFLTPYEVACACTIARMHRLIRLVSEKAQLPLHTIQQMYGELLERMQKLLRMEREHPIVYTPSRK